MTKHTPTPWTLKYPGSIYAGERTGRYVGTISESETAHIGAEDRANAEFIVRAANSHEELLVLAKRVKEWRQYWNERDQLSNHDDKIWEMANNAIANAEARP